MAVSIVSFVIFAFTQIITPGPANMIMLTTGARYGFRAALPFVGGVILGKQIIIWPLGLWLLNAAVHWPYLFFLLKYLSACYILWLAWLVANLRLTKNTEEGSVPGFFAGLWVHPLNPKAWAMIITGFTNFVSPEGSNIASTGIMAACLLVIQMICHPIWTFFGDRIAQFVSETPYEKYLMWSLSVITIVVLGNVLFFGV